MGADGGVLYPVLYLKWTLLYLGFAVIIYMIVKFLHKNYGLKKIAMDDKGIIISSYYLGLDKLSPIKIGYRHEKFFPWEGVLDINTKKAGGVFASLANFLLWIKSYLFYGFTKISQEVDDQGQPILSTRREIKPIFNATIFTLDETIKLNGLVFNKHHMLINEFNAFTDTLEERVIDFGYGASLSVLWRRLKRSKLAMFGLFIVIFFTAMSLLIIILYNTISARFRSFIHH